MSEITEKEAQSLPQVSKIWTGETVTKEWVLEDWTSNHEQLIDFGTCSIPFGYSFDKNCKVNLYLGRHAPSGNKTKYVSLWGSIKSMKTPTYMAGMFLSVMSKTGEQCLDREYVNFKNNSDDKGKWIKQQFLPHTRDGNLVIKEKNLELLVTLEPIYISNKPTAPNVKVEESNISKSPVATTTTEEVDNVNNVTSQLQLDQPSWIQTVRKVMDEFEEKKKQPGFTGIEVALGVSKEMVEVLNSIAYEPAFTRGFESSVKKLTEQILVLLVRKENMFQMFDLAKRCGFEETTATIAKYIKENI